MSDTDADTSPKKASHMGLKEKMQLNPLQRYVLLSNTLYLTQ